MADNMFHILDNKAEKFHTVLKILQLRCIFLLRKTIRQLIWKFKRQFFYMKIALSVYSSPMRNIKKVEKLRKKSGDMFLI